MNAIDVFKSMIERVPADLRSIPCDQAKPKRNGGWSAAQELGHLLDSAIMNHTRVIRVLTEIAPELPSYDGDFCVAAHAYAERDWDELIIVWEKLNRHFLMAVDHLPEESWQRTCFSEGKQVRLELLFADYVSHALHHLQHIGIDVETFPRALGARVLDR